MCVCVCVCVLCVCGELSWWNMFDAKYRFATIGSLRGEDEEDSSDEEGQAFYAGGSERGGLGR